MSLFLLDSNIFIEAKNRYYGFDFCPIFWDFIDKEINKNTILTIKEVYNELSNGNDDLTHWIKERKDSAFFISFDDEETQKEFAQIAQYVVDNFSQEEANKVAHEIKTLGQDAITLQLDTSKSDTLDNFVDNLKKQLESTWQTNKIDLLINLCLLLNLFKDI